MVGMRRVRMLKTKKVLALVIVPVAALVSLGIFSMVQAQADTAPSYATAQQQWQGAFANAQARAPKPLLPVADRSIYVKDFQNFAGCMRGHGISDFPNAPSTLGDGNTPEPLISGPPGSDLDPASSAFQSALAACPYTSHVPASDFESQATPTTRANTTPRS
jgi:hypothetical protein